MFESILIANRGEIACRVIRSSRAMGIRTIAVYSEADRDALHVDMASDAVLIGPPPALESYLNIDAIMAAIEETDAEAVHPGYGFLSENAAFAERLASEGVTFVGPPSSAIRTLGDKIEAKHLAESAGVPTVPGHADPIADAAEAARFAKDIGYPVMLKASAGGGGKGIRRVMEASELEEAFRACTSEAEASFGDGRVFLEKLILKPRHIEIQVLADTHGNAVYLGERECSIQRRHQKVLEEAPSPFVDPEMRAKMGGSAVDLARAVNYFSAGTVEFIVDADRNYYFLEMNTRLQVEHPVTEEVTGTDLVEQMIRVAAGEELSFGQDDVTIEGWAIEARLYAEDPARGFLPSIGRVARYREPVSGAFGTSKTIRIDHGVNEGDTINRHYDPMLAKLIAIGEDRMQAVTRMRAALDEFYVRGVNHNMAFLGAVVADEDFAAGNISTDFIGDKFGSRFDPTEVDRDPEPWLVAVAGAIHWRRISRASRLVTRNMDDQVIPGRPVRLATSWVVMANGRPFPVELAAAGDGVEVRRNGQTYMVSSDWTPSSYLFKGTVNGEPVCAQYDSGSVGFRLTSGGYAAEIQMVSPRAAEMIADIPDRGASGAARNIVSPMPGLMVSIDVEVGQEVKAGDAVAVIEAMKMENQLIAERDGTIAEINCAPGDSVEVNQVLMVFEGA